MPALERPDSVVVEVIAADGTRRAVSGVFRCFTSKWLTLTAQEAIKASLAVSIEFHDVLFVGEVVACCVERSDNYRIDIAVEHTLTSLQSLLRLRTELLDTEKLEQVRPLAAYKTQIPN